MLTFLFTPNGIAQTKPFHNIQEAIDYHITELKKGNWDNLKHIFVSIKLDSVPTREKVLVIENSLDTKYLRRNETNLLVQVTLSTKSNRTELSIVNFVASKKSRHHLYLTNLGSGGKYMIE